MSTLLHQLIARQEERYLTVEGVLYRLRSVDAAALASVGHAYLVGVEQHLRLVEDKLPGILAELRQIEATPEAIADAERTYRADEAARAQRAHEATMADPAARDAYRERIEAFAMAAIAGMGMGAPGVVVELHPIGYRAETEPVKVVRAPSPKDRLAEALALADRGEYPLWALPAAHLDLIGRTAAQLAGGRAASVAPFCRRAIPVGGA